MYSTLLYSIHNVRIRMLYISIFILLVHYTSRMKQNEVFAVLRRIHLYIQEYSTQVYSTRVPQYSYTFSYQYEFYRIHILINKTFLSNF